MSFGTTRNESFDMVIKWGLLAKANPRAWHSSLDIPGGALICREKTAWGIQCPMVTYLVSILSSQSQGKQPSLITGIVWIHRSMVPCPWPLNWLAGSAQSLLHGELCQQWKDNTGAHKIWSSGSARVHTSGGILRALAEPNAPLQPPQGSSHTGKRVKHLPIAN